MDVMTLFVTIAAVIGLLVQGLACFSNDEGCHRGANAACSSD